MIAEFKPYYIDIIQKKDAWNLCDFIVANEDRLRRFFPKTIEQNLTPTLSKRFTKKKTNQFELKEEFLFVIKKNKTDALVGLVYIKKLDWIKKQGEIAYCIGYPFERQKITSKAVKIISNYAFNHLGLKVLQIIVHMDNMASTKVATHNGFIWKETLIKEFTPPNEKPLDMELYELYER